MNSKNLSNNEKVPFPELVSQYVSELKKNKECNDQEILYQTSPQLNIENNDNKVKTLSKIFKRSHSPYFINTEKNYLMMKTENDETVMLSNFIPVPILQEIIHEHDESTSFQIIFEAIKGNETLTRIKIPINKLGNTRWVNNSWGMNCRINMDSQFKNHFCEAIYILCENILSIHKYKSIGWLENKWSYLHSSGIIGVRDTEKIATHEDIKDFSLTTLDITEETACKFVVDIMFNLAEKQIAWTALSFTFLSLITSKLKERGQNPEFIYLLVGDSGSRKTSFSKAAFNIFEKYLDNVPLNIDLSTGAAMEQIATQFKDCVCLYDDIPPANTKYEANEQKRKLEKVIRMYGDSIGRQKIKNSEKIELKPAGLAAVTAESLVTQSASSLARALYVKVTKDSVDLNTLSMVQENKFIFPTAIYNYLNYIANYGEKYIDEFVNAFSRYRKLFSKQVNTHPVHPRLIDTAAWLQTSFDFYLNYIQSVLGPKKRWEKLNIQNFEMLIDMIIRQASMVAQENDVNIFISNLKEMLVTNQVKLQEVTIKNKKKVTKADTKTSCIGYYDDQYLYFFKDTVYEKVKNQYERTGSLFPTNLRTLLEKLEQHGLLVPNDNNDKTKTIKLTINNSRIRVIRINRKLFQKWD